MYEICYAKFEQNKILQKKLFDTGSKQLIEGNSWHDTTGECAKIVVKTD